MIDEEIAAFEKDWSMQLQRGRNLNITIGTKEEMAASSKQLNELQDISNQATESTDALSMEIQSLRISLNETFSMVTEAKAKRAMYSNLEWVFVQFEICQITWFPMQRQYTPRHLNYEPNQSAATGETATAVGNQRSTVSCGEQTDWRLLVVTPAEC